MAHFNKHLTPECTTRNHTHKWSYPYFIVSVLATLYTRVHTHHHRNTKLFPYAGICSMNCVELYPPFCCRCWKAWEKLSPNSIKLPQIMNAHHIGYLIIKVFFFRRTILSKRLIPSQGETRTPTHSHTGLNRRNIWEKKFGQSCRGLRSEANLVWNTPKAQKFLIFSRKSSREEHDICPIKLSF